jgi:hypothetical protein
VGAWPGPEVAATVDRVDIGRLHLSPADIDDLIAFLTALNDEPAPRG